MPWKRALWNSYAPSAWNDNKGNRACEIACAPLGKTPPRDLGDPIKKMQHKKVCFHARPEQKSQLEPHFWFLLRGPVLYYRFYSTEASQSTRRTAQPHRTSMSAVPIFYIQEALGQTDPTPHTARLHAGVRRARGGQGLLALWVGHRSFGKRVKIKIPLEKILIMHSFDTNRRKHRRRRLQTFTNCLQHALKVDRIRWRATAVVHGCDTSVGTLLNALQSVLSTA